ncbi:MAG: helix-turn-helix domain-containing protein [Treponema sp.]|nr:helix-turn-helix domain-containing protein [Treponema sp.]
MQDFEIRNRVAENIRTIRKEKKLTQFQLAEKSNLSEAAIKSIELSHSYPEEKTLSQITEALEIDVVKLFMPVGESFKENKENTSKLKSAIANDVRNYVNEVLKEFE